MKKNIFKKFVVISFVFVSLFINDVFAEDVTPDTTAPVIELIGEQKISIDIGDSYIDQGVTAVDNIDGDISSSVLILNPVDVTKAGVYIVTYNVSDVAGNKALQIEREVEVKDIIYIPNLDVFIRDNENIIYDSAIGLPTSGVVNLLDNEGLSHEVNSQSVLALIYSLSQEIDAPFVISNLQYYSSMNAFYLKCITPKGGVELCDNWQYVVGGVTPGTGIDQTLLFGNESVGLYFGTPHKLTLDKNEILEGESVNVNSFRYNYEDNTWDILAGVNISASIPNAIEPWNPTVISETSVDENGLATIAISNEGIYSFGIKEDYSFPSYQVVVKKKDNNGGSSGGDNANVANFSIENAVNFLLENQEEDGYFGNSLYTDWVAISTASISEISGSFKNTILNYLKNEEFQSSVVTDNERHAMALMSLGINPYTGTSIDYIQKITSSFDGTQLGDSSLYNDDIFGLIILSHAGYTKNDEIIKSVASYIISKQDDNGSWGSIDMTAAGIQALSNLKNLNGVEDSIASGELYLKDKQTEDGGFENSFSTSWAIQALSQNNSFNEEVDKGIKYLAGIQHSDGGLNIGSSVINRIWATAYALPAISKLSWNEILENFDKDEKIDNVLQDEEKEEIEEPLEIETPILLEPEVKIIEKPIILNKIEKRIENKEKIEPLIEEEVDSDLLLASALGSIKDEELSDPLINRILNIIKGPFVWLWIVLGF